MKKSIDDVTFTRGHYRAISVIINGMTVLSPASKRSVIMHFDAFFRRTQDGYNSEAFLKQFEAQEGREP